MSFVAILADNHTGQCLSGLVSGSVVGQTLHMTNAATLVTSNEQRYAAQCSGGQCDKVKRMLLRQCYGIRRLSGQQVNVGRLLGQYYYFESSSGRFGNIGRSPGQCGNVKRLIG